MSLIELAVGRAPAAIAPPPLASATAQIAALGTRLSLADGPPGAGGPWVVVLTSTSLGGVGVGLAAPGWGFGGYRTWKNSGFRRFSWLFRLCLCYKYGVGSRGASSSATPKVTQLTHGGFLMRRTKSTLMAVAFATALLAPLLSASPASAVVVSGDGCNAAAGQGAEIGQYPSMPSSQSGLVISCLFNNQPGTSQVAASFTLADFGNANYHNGAARTVTSTAIVALGATTFTATNCTGITGWVNYTITADPYVAGNGVPTGAFVKSISGACLVTLSAATTAAFPAAQKFRIDNHQARRMANTAPAPANISFAAAGVALTSVLSNFTAADIGLSVTGTEIAPDTTITAVAAPVATINNAALAASSATTVITFGSASATTSTRQCGDATSTVTVVTSAACKFKTSDVGLPMYNITTPASIPANTYITSVAGNNATSAGAAMTVTAAAFKLVVGDPTVTAPNGVNTSDQVASQGINLDLNPSLVAGSQACSAEDAEGFAVVATWKNPGDFSGSAAFNTPPAGSKVLGQIYMDTSAADFSAFVVERNNGLVPGDFFYDVVTPNAPTTVAMCPGTATSPGLGYSLRVQAQTSGVATLPSGTGRPGTAQVRNLEQAATYGAGYTSIATLTSNTAGVVYAPAGQFTRTCIYASSPSNASFKCGNG